MVNLEDEMKMEQTPPINPIRGLAGSAIDVASDAASLAELQIKLAGADINESSKKARLPLALAILGSSGMVASLPVLAFGLASGLAAASGMTLWMAQLIAAASLIALSGLTIYLAVRGLRASLAPLQRSWDELGNNLSWLRATLNASRSPSPRSSVQ